MKGNKSFWWWGGGIVAILAALFYLGGGNKAQSPITITNPETLPGIQLGDAPWGLSLDNLRERLNAIGLPALAEEGTALHTHEHLDIFIHGNNIPVPADIGVNDPAGFISPIHVHDDTGIIHVESPKIETFTLGQFFDVWGVRFTSQCLGGYCSDAASTLQVFVSGTLYTGDPRLIEFQSHQEIAVVYGTADEMPKNIPSSYSFPPGY